MIISPSNTPPHSIANAGTRNVTVTAPVGEAAEQVEVEQVRHRGRQRAVTPSPSTTPSRLGMIGGNCDSASGSRTTALEASCLAAMVARVPGQSVPLGEARRDPYDAAASPAAIARLALPPTPRQRPRISTTTPQKPSTSRTRRASRQPVAQPHERDGRGEGRRRRVQDRRGPAGQRQHPVQAGRSSAPS